MAVSELGMYERNRLVMDYAVMYTNAKGRMPRDVHELRDWLREFAKLETERADLMKKLYEEEIETRLTRTVLVKL